VTRGLLVGSRLLEVAVLQGYVLTPPLDKEW